MSEILLSLCMIVRNAAETLPQCLSSITPWVDELVIVDTGSVDETREIAQQFSARLVEFPWCNDFSAARNVSLSHARGEWIFWMDADDVIDSTNGAKLQALVRHAHPRATTGFVLQVHCPGENSAEWTTVDHVKVFRNHPALRFEGRIHEQILPSIRAVGGKVDFTDIFIVHSGADYSPEGRKRKHTRDLALLFEEAGDRPNHPFTLFNLGMTLIDMGRCHEAVIHLEASLAFSAGESHVRKLHALICAAYQQIGRTRQAIDACKRGLSTFPDDSELWFRLGALWHKVGELKQAEEAYLHVAGQTDAPRVFLSRDASILGHKLHHNLGVVYADQGRHADATARFRRALASNSAYEPSLQELVRSLLVLGEVREAWNCLDEYISNPHSESRLLLESRIQASASGPPEALAHLRRGLEQCPDNLNLLREIASVSFASSDFGAAETALARITALQPNDSASHHNLGLVMLKLGRFEEALKAIQISLSLRPAAEETQALEAHCRTLLSECLATTSSRGVQRDG